MRKLIPNKIQFALEDVKARFRFAYEKEQITSEQNQIVIDSCEKILAILPTIKRKRRSEEDGQDIPSDKIISD